MAIAVTRSMGSGIAIIFGSTKNIMTGTKMAIISTVLTVAPNKLRKTLNLCLVVYISFYMFFSM